MLTEMMPPIDGMGIICYGSVVNKSEDFWWPASADRDEDFSGANRSLRILWCRVCLPACLVRNPGGPSFSFEGRALRLVCGQHCAPILGGRAGV